MSGPCIFIGCGAGPDHPIHAADNELGHNYWPQPPSPPPSLCIDCGAQTTPGKGLARCPSCWENRCGYLEDLQSRHLDE